MIKHAVCPICNDPATMIFLERRNVPVHQNLVLTDPSAASNVVRGDLVMAVCQVCGFVFNQAFDENLLNYGQSYNNSQECSPIFRTYTDELVDFLVEKRGVQGCRIVEVGCGKGAFLRKLVQVEGSENHGLGLDPTYEGPLTDLGGRLRFEKRFYGPDCANEPADVVICRHVIEHVPQPLTLLRNVRASLVNSPEARVFFETPCVEWILKNQVIWDFFYEHCSIFSPSSIKTAFAIAGFETREVSHVFGGQYLWMEATLGRESMPVDHDPGRLPEMAHRFAVEEARLRSAWHRQIVQLNEIGRVAVWGAGAKGVTFASLIDPGCEWIDCLVDLNPSKQGGFVPGTSHPIVDYRELTARDVRSVVVMNENYRSEISDLLSRENIPAKIIAHSAV